MANNIILHWPININFSQTICDVQISGKTYSFLKDLVNNKSFLLNVKWCCVFCTSFRITYPRMFSYYESNNRKLIIFFYILTNHYAWQQRCKETPNFKRFVEGYRISKIKSKASINQILQTIIILRCIYVFCLAFSGLQTSG